MQGYIPSVEEVIDESACFREKEYITRNNMDSSASESSASWVSVTYPSAPLLQKNGSPREKVKFRIQTLAEESPFDSIAEPLSTRESGLIRRKNQFAHSFAQLEEEELVSSLKLLQHKLLEKNSSFSQSLLASELTVHQTVVSSVKCCFSLRHGINFPSSTDPSTWAGYFLSLVDSSKSFSELLDEQVKKLLDTEPEIYHTLVIPHLKSFQSRCSTIGVFEGLKRMVKELLPAGNDVTINFISAFAYDYAHIAEDPLKGRADIDINTLTTFMIAYNAIAVFQINNPYLIFTPLEEALSTVHQSLLVGRSKGVGLFNVLGIAGIEHILSEVKTLVRTKYGLVIPNEATPSATEFYRMGRLIKPPNPSSAEGILREIRKLLASIPDGNSKKNRYKIIVQYIIEMAQTGELILEVLYRNSGNDSDENKKSDLKNFIESLLEFCPEELHSFK